MCEREASGKSEVKEGERELGENRFLITFV